MRLRLSFGMAGDRGLPPGVTVFERGWLSANNILFHGAGRTALVDSGYCTHADQTVALVAPGLGGPSARPAVEHPPAQRPLRRQRGVAGARIRRVGP